MTKPLTSVAAMMLYEEGRFQLDDPISKFIPAFANPRVYAGGSRGKIDSTPAEREINFRDLQSAESYRPAKAYAQSPPGPAGGPGAGPARVGDDQ